MPLLQGKKNIGHNIMVEKAAGKPHRQAVAIALSTARKSGGSMSKHLPIRNAPLYDDGTKEPGFTGKDQWREPLSGPSDRTVGNPPGEMSNLKAFEQNQSGTQAIDPGYGAPIQESDFPEKGDFSPGTNGNLSTGGLV